MTNDSLGIKSILEALTSSSASESQALYAQIQDYSMVKQACEYARAFNPDRFHFALIYPLGQVVDAVLEGEFPGKRDAQFLMANVRFLGHHLDRIFDEYDGELGCRHDKTLFIQRSLMRFFVNGDRIEIDYAQESTYFLPKRVLNDHDSIVEFFGALQSLFYGNPARYIKALQSIMQIATEADKKRLNPE